MEVRDQDGNLIEQVKPANLLGEGSSNGGSTPPVPTPASSPVTAPNNTNVEVPASKNPVKKVNFEVDLKQKVQQIQEPANLLSDDDLDKEVTQPTAGDKRNQELPFPATNSDAGKSKDTNSSTSSTPPPLPMDPTKRRKKAEKWAKLLDMGIIFGLKAWSGKADDVGLTVPKSDMDVLADCIEDLMVEYNVNTNPIVEGLSSLAAIYATPFKNAQKDKRMMEEFKKTEAYKKAKEDEAARRIKEEPKLDLFKGTYKKKQGGQKKA